jgi:dTDP-4-dehydrorhamnose 3,5-epimerase
MGSSLPAFSTGLPCLAATASPHVWASTCGYSVQPMTIFNETDVSGVFVLAPEPVEDERGSFSRAYCMREFAVHGIDFSPVQVSFSRNPRLGTLRGLHYQAEPCGEAKLVRCSAGAAYDVAVDLRPKSPTYTRWTAVELTSTNGLSMFIPRGCAHGFQTLEDHTELLYLISEFYDADAQRGIRWDDPVLGIEWPEVPPRVISERDRHSPYFAESAIPNRQ